MYVDLLIVYSNITSANGELGYDNPNVVIRVTGPRANAVIFFCYLLIVIYALTLAPVAWIYAAEVWSLETRATGVSFPS